MRLEVVRIVADWLAGYTLDVNGAQQGVNQQITLNRARWTEALDNAAWGKAGSTITADAVASPLGTMTADKIVEDTGTGGHNANQGGTPIVAGEVITVSAYFKAAERTRMRVRGVNPGNTDWFGASVNMTDGSVTSATLGAGVVSVAPVLETLPNGWFRLTVAGIINNTDVTATIVLALEDAAGNLGYTGDGSSGAYAWGAQMLPYSAVLYPPPYRQIQGTADSVDRFPKDVADPFPPPIAEWTDPITPQPQKGLAVYDETRHDWASNRLMDPPTTPALSVIVQDRIQVTGEATPDGQIRRTHGPIQLAIRYLTANVDLAEGVRDGDYIVRAVIRSLRELSRNQNEEARKRNSVLLELFEDPTEIYPIIEAVGDTYVAGAVVVNCRMRDYKPVW